MTDSISSKKTFCDEKELALEIDIAVATLRNWRCKGEGPAYVKFGKRSVRYARAAIDAFVAEGSMVKGDET